jgi:hypothetical protein
MLRVLLLVAGLVAIANPAAAIDIVVASGTERSIGVFGAINSMCESAGGKPEIRERAANGSFEIRRRPMKVSNRSSHCLGRPVEAYVVVYRSRAGFRGSDRAVISTYLFNGRVDVRTDTVYNIVVK